ncbi:MAG: phage terminase large subunit [Patescibacteria group bacterium]|nr:phage terminase large subunit [Patescibacteria group bacterium]
MSSSDDARINWTRPLTKANRQQIPLDATAIENFLEVFIAAELSTPRPTPPFHRLAWAMATSPHPRVAAAAPRGHAKSTGITFVTSLCELLFRVCEYTVIVSNTHKKATEFVRNIKTALLDNRKIRAMFKIKRLIKDSEDDFICECEDGHQFRVQALGFGMSVRGLLWGTRRPDRVMCDDMEDDEQVLSPERREKARDWFFAALMPALSVDGKIRVVGTVMHSDALLQNVLEDESWLTAVWEAHDDDFENVLWPEMYDEAYFRDKQAQFIRQGKLDKYNMEYRNRAYDTSAGLFRDEDLLPIEDSDRLLLDRNTWQRVVGGDFAITVKQKRDYTVFVVGVIGPEYLYIVDVVRRRMESEDIVRSMIELEQAHRLHTNDAPLQWFEEDGAIRRALGFSLELTMRKERIYLNLCPMNPQSRDKRVRSMAIRARVRAKQVKFDKQASWWPQLRQELVEFDRGRYDDSVDALAWLGIGVTQMGTPPDDDELDEEEWFLRRRQVAAKGNGGVNKTTGY